MTIHVYIRIHYAITHFVIIIIREYRVLGFPQLLHIGNVSTGICKETEKLIWSKTNARD